MVENAGIPSADKHLLIIPRAGHNDLMHLGMKDYFTTIHKFVSPKAAS